MADIVLRENHSRVISSVAGAVNGYEFRTGGRPISVQFSGPASLNQLEGSHDKLTWFVLNDLQDAAISGVGAGFFQVQERPKWARHAVATDAGGPQNFNALIAVEKESE